MHYGIEVEGRLRGVKTLFVSADDIITTPERVLELSHHGITHVYVSDRENLLDYGFLGQFLATKLITLDITKVHTAAYHRAEIPANITLMLTLPHELWESVAALGPDDQVKFHSEDRHVLCVSARHLVPTNPSEFADDVET